MTPPVRRPPVQRDLAQRRRDGEQIGDRRVRETGRERGEARLVTGWLLARPGATQGEEPPAALDPHRNTAVHRPPLAGKQHHPGRAAQRVGRRGEDHARVPQVRVDHCLRRHRVAKLGQPPRGPRTAPSRVHDKIGG